MHSLNLVHRDLKFENILLGQSGAILLTDFGFSRLWDPTQGLCSSICGTADYSSPEVVNAMAYDPIRSDSWSLGVMLYVMLFNQFPFRAKSIPELLQIITKGVFTLPFAPSDSALELLNKLIALNPADRLTAQEVLDIPWMNKNRGPRHKGRHAERVNRAVFTAVKQLGYVEADTEADMTVDEVICHRVIRRQYLYRKLDLPQQPSVYVRMLHPPPPENQTLERALIVSRCRYRKFQKERSVEQKSGTGPKGSFRNNQTMRFRMLSGDVELPIMDCDHTTLDPFDVLFKKLLHFLEREEGIALIAEHDFCLYCKVTTPQEIDVSITFGRVWAGFQLIGFSVWGIKGDPKAFKAFESKLSEYIGF
jgi:serine/threonine protein kinase